MLGKSPSQDQTDLFKSSLKQLINPKHPLVILAGAIPWQKLEAKFANLYSNTGTPSHPLRKMLGILLLQRIHNFSDEYIVDFWKDVIYFQYFCGEAFLQWGQPCASSDLVYFRRRLGKEGIEYLLSVSISMHSDKVAKAKGVLVDTTVQEKNITFPTNAKLYRKVIDRCNKIAKKAGVELRQNYRFVVQKLMYVQRYFNVPKHAKKAAKAVRKLRTLAGRQVRDLQRKLQGTGTISIYQKVLLLMDRIVKQEKNEKDKIYSLCSPEVSCIAKGKAHKKYEFGSKVAIATLPGSNVVVGAQNFTGNPNDGKTLAPTLETVKRLSGREFDHAIVDRGYRGRCKIGETKVILPGVKNHKNDYARRKHKLRCRSRSAIEAIIGHLKSDHRMGRNYLKGVAGDEINALLAGIGFNFRMALRKVG